MRDLVCFARRRHAARRRAATVLLPPWTADYERAARQILALRREVVTALGRYGEPTHQALHRVRDHLTDAAMVLALRRAWVDRDRARDPGGGC